MEKSQSQHNTTKKELKGTNLVIIITVIVSLLGAYFVGSKISSFKFSSKFTSSLNSEESVVVPDFEPTQSVTLAVVTGEDHIYGDEFAPIAIVEYSDLECSFCGTYNNTIKEFVDKNEGKVMWVYRHFPIENLHQNARLAAEATECAYSIGGEDVFWKMLASIHESADEEGNIEKEKLPEIAKNLNIHIGDFEECLDTKKFELKVESIFNTGLVAGVESVPTTFVMHMETGALIPIEGSISDKVLQAAVNEMMSYK
ncbi:MAG: DsbA family protein [Patescibacteria group bacterium]